MLSFNNSIQRTESFSKIVLCLPPRGPFLLIEFQYNPQFHQVNFEELDAYINSFEVKQCFEKIYIYFKKKSLFSQNICN